MVGVNRTQNTPTEPYGRRDRAQNATRRETPPSPTATPPLSGEAHADDQRQKPLLKGEVAEQSEAGGVLSPRRRNRNTSPRRQPPRPLTPLPAYIRPDATSRRRTIHDPMKRKNASPRQRETAPDLRSPSRARTSPIPPRLSPRPSHIKRPAEQRVSSAVRRGEACVGLSDLDVIRADGFVTAVLYAEAVWNYAQLLKADAPAVPVPLAAAGQNTTCPTIGRSRAGLR